MPDTIATNRRKVSEYSDLALIINWEYVYCWQNNHIFCKSFYIQGFAVWQVMSWEMGKPT